MDAVKSFLLTLGVVAFVGIYLIATVTLILGGAYSGKLKLIAAGAAMLILGFAIEIFILSHNYFHALY